MRDLHEKFASVSMNAYGSFTTCQNPSRLVKTPSEGVRMNTEAYPSKTTALLKGMQRSADVPEAASKHFADAMVCPQLLID
jgi:hypothetical protein